MSTFDISSTTTHQTVMLRDGRSLGYAECGDLNGKPAFHFHGHPGSRLDEHHEVLQEFQTRIERATPGDEKMKDLLLHRYSVVREIAKNPDMVLQLIAFLAVRVDLLEKALGIKRDSLPVESEQKKVN